MRNYRDRVSAVLRAAEANWGAIGSAIFFVCWLLSVFVPLVALGWTLSGLVGEDSALLISVTVISPHIILTFGSFFTSLMLVAEAMWRVLGVYRIFGVSGSPIKEKFLKSFEED